MVVLCNTPFPENTHYDILFNAYPYPLSDFQKYAIQAVVDGDHVLVTAHTGSGKTLPAEFAIQYHKKLGKKVVYTSPIKALSNQKYYEFSQKYPDITFGLFTGDIKTNPDADVLIMTTEILMNYLFRDTTAQTETPKVTLDFNLDIVNDLGCVVFDEVHYINDKDRGQVWEKTILMLPRHIQMVMLSATIDNPAGFADWCESGRNGGVPDKKVYLASTNKRVVPLSHYGFITVNEGMFKGMKDKALEKSIRDNTNTLLLLQNEKGAFQETTVHTLNKMLSMFDNKQVYMKRQQVLNKLALHLRDHEMLPAIAFVFSRKHVEMCAKEITIPLLEDDSKVGYNVRRECEQIVRKLPNFREYLELPEYNSLVSLLEKGIGIHHSGMIPILREIVELMISKKYIKMLFATESFAIGLDCPIKTAIFTNVSKFDGAGQRYLMAHEYTQMAGRAGRRGLDTVGYVVHCNNLFPVPSMNDYKTILSGKPQKLVSKFHVAYSLVLNLLKNGQDCDFHLFSEKSMIKNELENSMAAQRVGVADLKDRLEKKEQTINMMRTPYAVCLKYIDLENTVKTLVNKKRKEAEREMQLLKDENRTLLQDIVTTNDYLQLEIHYDHENIALEFMDTYIQKQTNTICDVLVDEGFIEIKETEPVKKYGFVEMGKIAANIAEVHPLIMGKMMVASNYFQYYSVRQLVGLFSCFTDIKLPSDERASSPQTNDTFLKEQIRELSKEYDRYASLEQDRQLRTGINYYDALVYDLVDIAMQWCNCENEEDCKYFIQTNVFEKGISIGEFNKAMMKITTVAKELMSTCEQMGQIELLHKLTQIEGLVLKYVATAQSLYV